jgi:hypothetical protein
MPSDDPPPEDFDYGDRLPDGQYENHPTEDEGEFVQPVRESYVHVDGDCDDGVTTMGRKLAESFARGPGQYSKTFCARCGDYFPLDEFSWKGTDQRLNEVGDRSDRSVDTDTDRLGDTDA